MTEDIASACVRIFRNTTGLDNTHRGSTMSDAEVLSAPIDSFGIDSLETMEFIMAVEDRFNVELDEEAVNGCRNVGELVELVTAARV